MQAAPCRSNSRGCGGGENTLTCSVRDSFHLARFGDSSQRLSAHGRVWAKEGERRFSCISVSVDLEISLS
ncbi:hypothetical protein Q5P01_015625 [Channa striata]|uniref:Uncharacterized protein n=1 Tax=Channa striata TaxID=64152 RepID=A0AA88MGA0_CHASR|nr:hypothetical protein Q5P01_015625 [Channa striata]